MSAAAQALSPSSYSSVARLAQLSVSTLLPRRSTTRASKIPTAEFRVADAMALPFADGEFDIVASALVINFIPDRAKALAEMRRVLRPGGIVTAYLWHRSATANDAPFAPIERGLETIGANVLRPPMRPKSTPEGARLALETAGFFRDCHHHSRCNPHIRELRGLLGNALPADRATGTIDRRAERRRPREIT